MSVESILADRESQRSIVLAGQRLHARNLLASCDGNISIRMDEGHILITPTGVPKGALAEGQMCVMNLEGKVLKGEPSGERSMHLYVYRNCPKAKAVVHAHPPHAIAWSVAFPELKELPSKSLSEVILAAGAIPIVSYARPGTAQMGENLGPYLPKYRALILARHGAICWGESLDEAVNGMERVEHSALILHLARQLGPLTELPAEEVLALENLRVQLGERLL